MKGAEKTSTSLSSGIGGINTAVLGFAGAIGLTSALSSAFGTLKSSVSTAFDRIDTMEGAMRTLNVMVGDVDAVTAALDRTREAVTGTAYTMDGAAGSLQRFVTSGTDINKAVGYVESWGNAVAFYGDGSQATFDTVGDALSKMLSAGKVGGDQLNRMLHANIPVLDIFADATGKSTSEVQKALSSGAISAEEFVDTVSTAFMEGGDKFPAIADAAKEAGSSWGSVFANMHTRAAAGMENIIEAIDEMLTDNGLPDMRAMIEGFGDSVAAVLTKVSTYVKPAAEAFKNLYPHIKPLVPAIKQIGKAVAIAVASIGAIGAFVGVVKIAAAGIAFLVSPIGLVIGGITALALGFQAAYKHVEPFRNAVDGIIGKIKEVGQAIMSGDMTNIMEALGLTPDKVSQITGFIEGVKSSVDNFVNHLAEKFSGLVEKFSGYGERLSGMWETLKGIFEKGAGAVGIVIKALGSVLGPVISIIISALGILGDIAMWAFEFVIVPLAGLVMSVFSTMWTILGPILQVFGAALGVVGEVGLWLWDNVLKPFADYLGGQFSEFIQTATGIVDKIGGAFEGVSGKVETLVGWIKDFAGLIKNIKVPDWVTSAAGGVVNFVTGGGGKSHFHGIDSVPYDGYQITAHKGERVLTAQENREYSGKSGGSTGGGGSVQFGDIHLHGVGGDLEGAAEKLMYIMAKKIESEGGHMA